MTSRGDLLYEGLLRRLHPSSLVFAQFGAFHRVEGCIEEIVEALRRRDVHCTIFDRLSTHLEDWSQRCTDRDAGIIVGLESILDQSDCEQAITHLRPQVYRAQERGARILLLSRVPIQRYPTLLASSVLLDAQSYSFRPLSEAEARRFLESRGLVGVSDVERIIEFSGGSRALLDLFTDAELADISGNAKMAKVLESETQVATATFRDLGPALCTWLEHWVFEAQTSSISVDDVPDATMQALRLAGVLKPTHNDSVLALLPMRNRELWVAALGEVIGNVVEPPPEWSRLAQELFGLERWLRLRLTAAFRERSGDKWPEVILADHQAGIIELARRDTTPLVAQLTDVRSPLDWLSLSQLLEIAADVADGQRLLGSTSFDWREILSIIVPIRNRIAHMRLAREGDWEIVRKTRRTLQSRASAEAARAIVASEN